MINGISGDFNALNIWYFEVFVSDFSIVFPPLDLISEEQQ